MGKYTVLGHDISYSLSPQLHAVFFDALGEDHTYTVTDVPPERLGETVEKLLAEYDGFNVTKPYKEKVAALLGGSAPVNTVLCRTRQSTSTDAEGFLQDYTRNFGAPCGRILLLGAGGAAKAVADALVRCDADVCVYNRTFERAEELARGRIRAVRDASGRYDAVINATSLGQNGEQAAPPSLDFRGVRYAYDLLYSPRVTPFMRAAADAGANVSNGLGMLVYQGIAAQEFWRGKPFAADIKKILYDSAVQALTQGEKV